MCKVSVIIPVYNVEKYLQQCIDSLVNQTLNEIELIFVNDASPDSCHEILQRNAGLWPELIKVIDLGENQRLGGARNTGIRAATGKYIGFVDSDDFVSKTMFEDLYIASESTGADISFIQYALVPDDAIYQENLIPVKTPYVTWNQSLLDTNGRILTDYDRANLIAHKTGGVYCGLYKRDFLLETRIDFPVKIRYEDNYWESLIKAYAKKVTYVEKIDYYYRFNPKSTLHLRNQSYHYDRITIEHMMISEARKRNLFDRYHEAWEYLYITRYFWNTWQIFLTNYDVPAVNKCVWLTTDLKKQFPEWNNNYYFNNELSFKMRKIIAFAVRFPRIAAIVFLFQNKMKRSFCIE